MRAEALYFYTSKKGVFFEWVHNYVISATLFYSVVVNVKVTSHAANNTTGSHAYFPVID